MKKVMFVVLSIFAGFSISAQCISGNCINGNGTFVFQDGSKYIGDFKKQNREGRGRMNYIDGSVYTGSWKKNDKNGKGKLVFLSGDTYVGQFRAGKFWGKGKYIHQNGDRYEGEWINHLAHGKGVYTFSDEERYEGDFFKGVFSGVGAFYYNDGTVFIGNWSGNMKEGEGKMHYDNGQKIHGFWEQDELVERGAKKERIETTVTSETSEVKLEELDEVDVLSSKRYWKDCTNSNCHNETGELRYMDGSKWQGQFMNSMPAGTGTMYYADGNKYVGEIDHHAPNGDGVMYFSSGTIIGATWVDGYPVKRKQKYDIPKEEFKVEVDESDEVKIWAIIIGVSSYAHMPTLRYTDDDAYQVFAFLKSPEGGALPNSQIKLLIDENATKENILSGMNEVLLKADENDVVLMYYSGHGLPGMFLPIDFDGYRNSLSHKEVLSIFNKSKAKHKICIADACHSGSLIAARSPFSLQMDEFYDEYERTSGGTAFIMSSKSEEVSLETSGLRQGIFSHYLIRGLNGEADVNFNKIVTVTELYDFIDVGVRKYTQNKQRPSIAGNFDEFMPLSTVR